MPLSNGFSDQSAIASAARIDNETGKEGHMRGLRRDYTGGRKHHLLLIALAIGALGAGCPAAAAAAESYVALGDSYTVVGSMTTLYKAETHCRQSADSYPYRVAEALHLSLSDVACGGAKTEDFTVPQYEDQPPQFDALSPATEVVSVGMGGNDQNVFRTLITGCTTTDSRDPGAQGTPCKKAIGKTLNAEIAADEPAWTKGLAEIHALAPKAKVFYVGYPDITPKMGFCPSGIPWTAGDLRWVYTLEKKFDHMMQKVARAGGATYVETFAPSEGHDACQKLGVRWVEPLINPANGVYLHPNGIGAEQDAYAIELAMLKAGIR